MLIFGELILCVLLQCCDFGFMMVFFEIGFLYGFFDWLLCWVYSFDFVDFMFFLFEDFVLLMIGIQFDEVVVIDIYVGCFVDCGVFGFGFGIEVYCFGIFVEFIVVCVSYGMFLFEVFYCIFFIVVVCVYFEVIVVQVYVWWFWVFDIQCVLVFVVFCLYGFDVMIVEFGCWFDVWLGMFDVVGVFIVFYLWDVVDVCVFDEFGFWVVEILICGFEVGQLFSIGDYLFMLFMVGCGGYFCGVIVLVVDMFDFEVWLVVILVIVMVGFVLEQSEQFVCSC